MAEPDRSRSSKVRKAHATALKISDEVTRNNLRAEEVLTQIEAREERTAARNAATNRR